MELTLRAQQELDRTWSWRDKFGNLHDPKEMETRHLFYTVRMIWNHSVPPHMIVGQNVKLYRFSSFYTTPYMRQSVLQCGAELMTRKDLEPWQWLELQEIASWVNGGEFDEVFYISGPRLMLS